MYSTHITSDNQLNYLLWAPPLQKRLAILKWKCGWKDYKNMQVKNVRRGKIEDYKIGYLYMEYVYIYGYYLGGVVVI